MGDLAMRLLEEHCLKDLDFQVPLYIRYVDDILLCVSPLRINYILDTFNSFDENLQFTVELPINNEISFLDLKLIIQDNSSIITN